MQAIQEARQVVEATRGECYVAEVLQSVGASMQSTCQSLGVEIALPQQLQSSSRGLQLTAIRLKGPAAFSGKAVPSSTAQRRSAQWAHSRMDSDGRSSKAIMSAPALLPPPSRMANHRMQEAQSLRAGVKAEVRTNDSPVRESTSGETAHPGVIWCAGVARHLELLARLSDSADAQGRDSEGARPGAGRRRADTGQRLWAGDGRAAHFPAADIS